MRFINIIFFQIIAFFIFSCQNSKDLISFKPCELQVNDRLLEYAKTDNCWQLRIKKGVERVDHMLVCDVVLDGAIFDGKSNTLALLLSNKIMKTLTGWGENTRLVVLNTIRLDTILEINLDSMRFKVKLLAIDSNSVLLSKKDNKLIRIYNDGTQFEWEVEGVLGVKIIKGDSLLIVKRHQIALGSFEFGFHKLYELNWLDKFGKGESWNDSLYVISKVNNARLWKGFQSVDILCLTL